MINQHFNRRQDNKSFYRSSASLKQTCCNNCYSKTYQKKSKTKDEYYKLSTDQTFRYCIYNTSTITRADRDKDDLILSTLQKLDLKIECLNFKVEALMRQ